MTLDVGTQGTIDWTKPKLEQLRKYHADAVKHGAPSFIYDGMEFVTGYAGYLIEYLAGELG